MCLSKQDISVINSLAGAVKEICFNANANSVECALVDGLNISGLDMDYAGYSLNLAVEALAGAVLTKPAFLAVCVKQEFSALDIVNMLKTAITHLAFMSPSQLGL